MVGNNRRYIHVATCPVCGEVWEIIKSDDRILNSIAASLMIQPRRELHESETCRKDKKWIEGWSIETIDRLTSSAIETEIRSLVARRAFHKNKRIHLGDETWLDLINHLYEEIDEFDDAVTNVRDVSEQQQKSDMLEELGDILGILVHATIKAGFTMQQVEERELAKLKERYEC